MLKLTIMEPSGQQMFTQDIPLNELAPGGLLDIPTPVSLQAADLGTYRVLGSVIDSITQIVLASDEAQFEVENDLNKALTGEVDVQLTELDIGSLQTCTFKITNGGSIGIEGLEVHHVVVNIATAQLVNDNVAQVDLPQLNGEHTTDLVFSTTRFAEGDHACVLQAKIDDDLETLAFAAFTLNQPPIQIDAEMVLGARGRLLVLLDPGIGGTCDGITALNLDTTFNPLLSLDAMVEAIVLNEFGMEVDREVAEISTFVAPVNGQPGQDGADLSIAQLAVNGLTLALNEAGSAGGKLGAEYSFAATINADGNTLEVISGPIDTSCSQPITIGDVYGDFTVADVTVLKGPPPPSGDDDPHGPQEAPVLSAQRTFLEALLTEAGWSYTIVEDDDAFTQELRSGGYTVYALFTEQEKLSGRVQEELREAVFRGEGLVEAGAHDSRHNKLPAALGIKHIGQVAQAIGVDIPPGPLGDGGSVFLIPGDHSLRVERVTAESAGTYLTSGGVGTDDAITTNAYGRGKSVFVGFDLLATATRDGEDSIAAQTLLAALAHVHPATMTQSLGSVVPIDIRLQNQGIAASVQVSLVLPAGTTVVDPGEADLDTNTNTLSWLLVLNETEERVLTFWLRLPDLSGPLSLTAQVAAGPDGQTVTFTSAPDIALTVEQLEELESIISRMQDLIDSRHPESKDLKKAKKFVEKALANFDPAAAIPDVLKADDKLLGITDEDVIDIRASLGIWIRWAAQFIN